MTGDDPEGGSTIDLDESLGVLANELRLRIIQVLAEAGGPERVEGLSYAQLKDRAGVEDNGQFNYHLGKLKGTFVIKREGDYYLRYAGHDVFRRLLSGTFDTRIEIEAFEIDSACPCCGARLEATYTRNQVIHVYCPECTTNFVGESYPAHGVESLDRPALLRAADLKLRHNVSLTSHGVCEWCGSRPDLSLLADPSDEIIHLGHEDSPSLYAVYACEQCGGFVYSTAGKAVLMRPPVVAFFHDHGVDLDDVPVWELDFAVTDRHTEILSHDPWRIELVVPCDDEELRLELDGDLRIVESERRAR